MVKKTYLLWLIVSGVWLLGLCYPAISSQQPASKISATGEKKDTLTLLYWQAPTILNPHIAAGTKEYDACRITYEPLATFDKNGSLIPFLASEIPSIENSGVAADGKSVTWKLKKEIKWSDGVDFTAEDVLFTYKFIMDPNVKSNSASSYTDVKHIEIIDKYTVKVNFKDVTPAWAMPFVGIYGMIIPRHKFSDDNGNIIQKSPANMVPVGTGPYRVVSFKPQEVLFLGTDLIQTNKIMFEPNPFFREQDKPYFQRVILKGGGTVSEAARSVLKMGDVDYAWNLQLDSSVLTSLTASGNGRLIANPGAQVERIVFNHSDPNKETEDGERSSLKFPHPLFSDLTIRQAFVYAVDRDIIARLYPESSATANVLVSPLIYNSPNTSWEYNPEKAMELLDEAGWKDTDGDGIRDKNGVKMSVMFQTAANPVRQETQKIVKRSLEGIGVEVNLEIIDSSVFFGGNPNNPKTYERFYADLEEYQIGNRSPDPGSYMQYFTCAQIPQKANNWKGRNVTRWCSPEYDELYEQSKTEIDPQKRRDLFIKMNDMLIQEAVLIPLVNRSQVAGASNTLTGLDPTPWDADTWNIKDWRRVLP